MKSKTKIGKQLHKKTNAELVETIVAAKKHKNWLPVAAVLSGPRRHSMALNLSQINMTAKNNETIVIPGKILSQGEIDKKVKIVAFAFSEKAREKLLKSKIPMISILEEIKKNPWAKEVRILTEK